jgi:chemotaxis signal transduction protein
MGELEMVVFRVGDASFATEVSQIISIAESPEAMEGAYESVPLVDLSMKLKLEAIEPVDIPAARTSLDGERVRNGTASVLLVDTGKGTVGVQVGSVKGVINMPLSQIEPLPEFLRDRIETDCIWGIGKQDQELIILLDIRRYVTDAAHEIVHT